MSKAKEQNNNQPNSDGVDPTKSFDGSVVGPGGQIGPFRIEQELGRGGVGVVYLAHDTKLDRSVAIKSLPAELMENPKARARFAREAKLLASLNHPNIATIHEVLEEAEGVGYLVLEYIPGQTLAERIAKSKLKFQDALSIAQQIAEAVATAHEHDVIHRDLKPGNIKITPEGKVKVLDFGLAKTLGGEATDQQSTVTEPGRIIGTPAYMSPEQARGKPTDKRSDIWSFGCVLYEMLTGKVPFEGETVSDTLASILDQEPDWDALPKATPANVQVLLRRCLKKDPRRRLRDIGDAEIEISEALTQPFSVSVESRTTPSALWKVAVLCVFAGLVVGVVAMLVVMRSPKRLSKPKSVQRYSIPLGPENPVAPYSDLGGGYIAPVLTPDGHQLIFAAGITGDTWLVTRSWDSLYGQRIPGTQGAILPAVSPDGRWLAFTAQGAVWTIPLAGGKPTRITDNPFHLPHVWQDNDTLILSTTQIGAGGLSRFDLRTSKSEPLTTLDATTGEIGHAPIQLDPESGTLFFVVATGFDVDNWVLSALSFENRQVKPLVEQAIGEYAPSGHLIYAKKGRLMAAPFDIETLKIKGQAIDVTEDQMVSDETLPTYVFSPDGTLVYVPVGGRQGLNVLVWVDLEGHEEILEARPMRYMRVCMCVSGDRAHPQIAAQVSGDSNIWVYDVGGAGSIRPVTFSSEADCVYPVWLPPDNREIVFFSLAPGSSQLYRKAADGSGQVQVLSTDNTSGWPYFLPHSFTPDGNVLLAVTAGTGESTKADIVAIHLNRGGEIEPLLASDDFEVHPILSPDGKWLAYTSDDLGRDEVFVTDFPNLEGKWQVSSKGGGEPVWAPDSMTVYYRDGTSFIGVSIETEGGFRLGETKRLFDDVYLTGDYCGKYAIHPEGKRFLMIKEIEDEKEAPVTELIIVENWFEELKRLAPTRKD